ncbi:MAG TPA: hypothetical protein VMH81_04350 [Bryobacteraceae bacterium]|nr:hypothetical protein [Bryobacteraceae bacterium]
MRRKRIGIRSSAGLLVLACALLPTVGLAQSPNPNAGQPAGQSKAVDQPDAQRTRGDLGNLLNRYPPALRQALALDPSLLGNQAYLAPYPSLVSFLNSHPEVSRDPSYYLGEAPGQHQPPDRNEQVMEMWRSFINGLTVFAAFGMAIGTIMWLIRTIIDYRRWSRLTRVQADVHTKLLDRFTANNDLLAYIQTPAGAKFLESTPIKLDAGPRSMGAPLARILWSVQGGVVLLAGGIGLQVVSSRVGDEAAALPLNSFGILGIAVGIGFVTSAAIAFFISQRMGLIETPPSAPRIDAAGPEGFGLRK